jgi:hypothetical protein
MAWHWGFLPWLVALPALPWTLWAAAALREPEPNAGRRRVRWGVLIAAVAFASLTHLAVAAIALVGVAALLWPREPRFPALGRWTGRIAAAGLPAAALAVLQIVSGRPHVPLAVRPTEWPGAWERLRGLWEWSVPGPFVWLGALFLGFVLLLVVAEAAGADVPDDASAPDARASRRRMTVFAGVLGAACLFLPRQAGDLHFAAERLVVPLLIVLAGVVVAARSWNAPRIVRVLPVLAWLAAVAAGAAVLAAQASAAVGFSDEVGNVNRIADLIPRGSRVLVLPIDARSDAVRRDVPLHLHTGSRVIERRGGIISIPPLANVGMPVEPAPAGLRALVVPEWGEGTLGALRRRIAEWDYVLVYARGGFPATELGPLAPYVREVLPPEHRGGPYAGPWFLLQVRR